MLWPWYRSHPPKSPLGVPVIECATCYVTLTCRWLFTKCTLLLLFIAQRHIVGISEIDFSVILSKLSRLQIAALPDTASFASSHCCEQPAAQSIGQFWTHSFVWQIWEGEWLFQLSDFSFTSFPHGKKLLAGCRCKLTNIWTVRIVL